MSDVRSFAPKVLDIRGFQRKRSYNFGPRNRYLRFVVADFWGIVAFNWALGSNFENSLRFCPVNDWARQCEGLASRAFGADLCS